MTIPSVHWRSVSAVSLAVSLLLAGTPSVLSAGFSRETVAHQVNANRAEFSLSARPTSVSLQGLVEKTGRWRNLVTRIRPKQNLGSLPIPAKWRTAQLRVVATYPSKSGKRIEVPSQIDEATRSVVFTSTNNARLFSVETRANGSSAWTRISTVAAPASPQSVRVPLPSSIAADAQIRVMEVSGQPRLFPPLKTPVSSRLRGGPAAFASHAEVVSAAGITKDSGNVPSVEESDIWKVRGRKIFFFNRLRGLQIIDASDPAGPRITGALSLAGAGEEMYLLGPEAAPAAGAILVTSLPWHSGSTTPTRITRISLAGDTPSAAANLELPGHYVESRLVGGLLHVVTTDWNSESGPKTLITSVDVSSGAALVATPSREFGVPAAAVGSTGKYLWFSGYSGGDWLRQTLFALPFKVDGSLGASLQFELDGAVLDKFKVGDTSDGLAVVLQQWNTDWQQVTSVQTLADTGGSLVPRGRIELVRGESLFATRYDRDRLYVVTFEQIDPLWIVDLSDSARPAVKGHLEVPGWSTFIQPFGDTLVAVGRDGGKVQVSLFDVSDEANPKLARRVDVGSGWSWSEAEWNEKAVKVLPEAGLILIPVVEMIGATRSDRVSLLDFDPTARTLSLRGTINHDFAPRRAALMDGQVIASVSNRELLLVNAANRDLPAVTAEIALAFGCDRVVFHKGTLLMFENGGSVWSGSPRSAVLRAANPADTQKSIAETTLPCDQVAAAEVIGDRLVVVETSGQTIFRGFRAGDSALENTQTSALSVWSLSDPARPALIGRTALPSGSFSDARILSAAGGRIVVASRDQGWGRWTLFAPVLARSAAPAVASVARISPPWLGWGGQGLRLAVADISGDAPSVLGIWELSGDEYSDISEVHSAGELLAFSFARSERSSAAAPDGWSAQESRSWLQIVDLADPSAPMAWAPVQIPGQLVGVSWLQRAGGVIFARSGQRVAALGFDGENASVAAEVDAGAAVAVQGSFLYVLTQQGVFEWEFSEVNSRWTQRPGWSFDPSTGASSLHIFDGAVIASAYDHAWVLGDDGSVRNHVFPAGADIARGAQSGSSLFVPAGEYGVLPISLAP